jgi:uncharacterized DUF497 family protein
MEFEWDEQKRRVNIAKHGIDFADACQAWEKPIIDPIDERFAGDEYRPTALGVIGADEIIVAIVYTPRDNVLRLISARRARRNERKIYQGQFARGQ